MILHGYWRSTATYRVRIALNLKQLPYTQVTYDLRCGAQQSPAFGEINPQMLVPALETDTGEILVQSPAILEWLDEQYPAHPLLPAEKSERAVVRAMAAVVGCDIHPLNNLRVLNSLRQDLDASQQDVDQWIARWISQGFAGLEKMLERHSGQHAFRDQLGMADCFIVPQVYSAVRFNVALDAYPNIIRVAESASKLAEFAFARPENQPDADRS